MTNFNHAVTANHNGYFFERAPAQKHKSVGPLPNTLEAPRKATNNALDAHGRVAVIATALSTVILGAFLLLNVAASLQMPSLF